MSWDLPNGYFRDFIESIQRFRLKTNTHQLRLTKSHSAQPRLAPSAARCLSLCKMSTFLFLVISRALKRVQTDVKCIKLRNNCSRVWPYQSISDMIISQYPDRHLFTIQGINSSWHNRRGAGAGCPLKGYPEAINCQKMCVVITLML